MELILFFILYIIFWIVYYYIEGRHDAAIIHWLDSTYVTDINELSYYSEIWHKFDAYEKALVHLVITSILLFIEFNVLAYLSLLILSLSIRIIVHNLIINKFRNLPNDYLGTDSFDVFLKYLESKLGISQWTFKLSIFFISLFFSILLLFFK